jgi:hypothetical protein
MTVTKEWGMGTLVETLSDYVHQGWMAEKQRQGFADHPWDDANARERDADGNLGYHCALCGKAKGMHHTDMLPYDQLEEHIKEYDRVTVRAVLAGIEAAGYRLWPQA